MERAERFVEIDAPVEVVFDRLSDFESFPRWMRNIREVRRLGRRVTRWVSETAVPDVYAEWEAELTVYEPDHRLVWRSVRGDIHADGEAVISETPEGTTLLHVVLGFGTPLGRSGAQAARFFGVQPGRQLEEDLERFRRLAEREGRGRQGYAGEGRRSSFAPVMSRREEPRRGAREERRPLRTREEGRVRDDAPPPRRDERMTRRRDYEDAPRRDEERIWRAPEREGGDKGSRPRYALTPRERERERDDYERRYDPRVSEMFGRRGVDRLLDEPPDGRRRGGRE
ncbi:MAG TPA: SRPBCC family protein [Pyrinomonadaceae bacterium]